MAAELGFLPLALAQAAAVIAGQHLGYGTYLERLRALPVAEYLTREEGQPYPHGVAEAVLLSLEAVRPVTGAGSCAGVMEVMACCRRPGCAGTCCMPPGRRASLAGGGTGRAAAAVDAALGRLAERSLLAFSLDGQAVIAHRLVLRVVRDGLAAAGAPGGGVPGRRRGAGRARAALADHRTGWPSGTFPSR